jgi:hypothetical protein
MEREIKKIVDRVLSEEINKAGLRIKNRIFENQGETCECGGMMYEGECMECGNMYEGDIQELGGMDDGHPSMGDIRLSDYSFEELDDILRGKTHKKGKHHSEEDDEDEFDFVELDLDEDECVECGPMYESKKLSKGQKHIAKQAKPYDEIDAGDFKKLRAKKSETKEGAKPDFLDLDDDGDKKEPMKSAAKQAKGKKVEETYYRIENFGTTLFTENEMVDMIEKIIKENTKYEKGKVSTSNVLKSSLNRSGKEENDYIKSVTKKMKEYLKDGSKGDYEMNPKHFPKGNGELEEMEKMAFSLTDDNEDFNYEIAGLNIPVPDAIEFNDERMNKYYEGSSETGNAPGGNALESDANSRFNKMRKKQTLDKLKKQSYNKAPQPVFNEKSGQEKGEGIKIKLESTEDKKVLSEISKMKNLIGYNQKTQ